MVERLDAGLQHLGRLVKNNGQGDHDYSWCGAQALAGVRWRLWTRISRPAVEIVMHATGSTLTLLMLIGCLRSQCRARDARP